MPSVLNFNLMATISEALAQQIIYNACVLLVCNKATAYTQLRLVHINVPIAYIHEST